MTHRAARHRVWSGLALQMVLASVGCVPQMVFCQDRPATASESPGPTCPSTIDRVEMARPWSIQGLDLVNYARTEAAFKASEDCLRSTPLQLGPKHLYPAIEFDYYSLKPDCTLIAGSLRAEPGGLTAFSAFGRIFAFRVLLLEFDLEGDFPEQVRSSRFTATVVDFVDEDCSGQFRYQLSGPNVKRDPAVPPCLSLKRALVRCEDVPRQD